MLEHEILEAHLDPVGGARRLPEHDVVLIFPRNRAAFAQSSVGGYWTPEDSVVGGWRRDAVTAVCEPEKVS